MNVSSDTKSAFDSGQVFQGFSSTELNEAIDAKTGKKDSNKKGDLHIYSHTYTRRFENTTPGHICGLVRVVR